MEEEKSDNQPRIQSGTAMGMIMVASFFSLIKLVLDLIGIGDIPLVTLVIIDTPSYVLFWGWCKMLTGNDPDNPRPVKYFKDVKTDWWKVAVGAIPVINLFPLVVNTVLVIYRSRKEDEEYFSGRQVAKTKEEEVSSESPSSQEAKQKLPSRNKMEDIRPPEETSEEQGRVQRKKEKEEVSLAEMSPELEPTAMPSGTRPAKAESKKEEQNPWEEKTEEEEIGKNQFAEKANENKPVTFADLENKAGQNAEQKRVNKEMAELGPDTTNSAQENDDNNVVDIAGMRNRTKKEMGDYGVEFDDDDEQTMARAA